MGVGDMGHFFFNKGKSYYSVLCMCEGNDPVERKNDNAGESEVLVSFSCVQLFVTPWTVAHQAPLSMGFSRQESWSGFPVPSPGDLPSPGIETGSPLL